MERRFVKIEKGLGPQGRIAVVRFDRGDNINALQPAGDARAARRAARLRGRSRDLGRDPDRLGQGLLGGLRPQGSRRPAARYAVGRRAHPSPAARPQDVQGLAGHGPGHDRRHRRPLHRRRRGAGRGARFPHLREERAFPHPRGRARHEHELGFDPAHAGADGAGAHQAGGDPGVRSHLRRRGAGLGPGREGRRRRPGLDCRHGIRRAHRPPAADPGAHDQDARSTASPTRSTISARTWTPTRTC